MASTCPAFDVSSGILLPRRRLRATRRRERCSKGMDATTLAPDAPLPTDVATLQAMVRELLTELQKLRAENAGLKTKLDAALKHRFGRRSERRTRPPTPAAEKPP